jgi:glycosidase
MRGGADPDNRRDFPGGWKGDPHNAFNSEGRAPEQQDVFTHVRKLMTLRRQRECLRRGQMLTLVADEQVWAYARILKQQVAVVVINNGGAASSAEITLSDLHIPSLTKWNPQLGTASGVVVEAGKSRVTLPARSSEIYFLDAP